MEYRSEIRYIVGHETLGNRTSAGEAPPTGNPVVKSGKESVGCGSRVELIGKLRISVAARLQTAWVEGTEPSTNAGTASEVIEIAKAQARSAARERSKAFRVPNGSVDVETDSRGDRDTLPSSVSSFTRLETSGEFGLELPSAGTAGAAKE